MFAFKLAGLPYVFVFVFVFAIAGPPDVFVFYFVFAGLPDLVVFVFVVPLILYSSSRCIVLLKHIIIIICRTTRRVCICICICRTTRRGATCVSWRIGCRSGG